VTIYGSRDALKTFNNYNTTKMKIAEYETCKQDKVEFIVG